MQESLIAAEHLVAEIGDRFRRGDAAGDLLTRLAERVATIRRLGVECGPDVPGELRDGITRLVALFQAAAGGGDDWLAGTAGQELAALHRVWRVRQAYGLSSRTG